MQEYVAGERDFRSLDLVGSKLSEVTLSGPNLSRANLSESFFILLLLLPTPRRLQSPGMIPSSDRVPEGADLLICGRLKPATKRHDVSRGIFKEINQVFTIGAHIFC